MTEPFEKVVARHAATVLRVCRVLLGPHDAEDAWSETFLAALRGYPDLPDSANTEAWLVTIAHRKAVDCHRGRARRAFPVAEVEALDTRAAGGVERGDAELWGAVRELPPRQRSAVLLRFLADLAHREIAATIGCSEDAARRSLHEGLQKLRAQVAA